MTLGLATPKAPHYGQRPCRLQNPLLEMAGEGLLDRGMFRLTRLSEVEDLREIKVGVINHDLYDGELRSNPPLTNTKDLLRIHTRWKVPATSISIGEGSAPLEGFGATLKSDCPCIALPDDFVTPLEHRLAMEEKGEHMHRNPLIVRSEISWRISLLRFMIPPIEYTIKFRTRGWADICV